MVNLQIAREFQFWYGMTEDSAGQFVVKDDDQSVGMQPAVKK